MCLNVKKKEKEIRSRKLRSLSGDMETPVTTGGITRTGLTFCLDEVAILGQSLPQGRSEETIGMSWQCDTFSDVLPMRKTKQNKTLWNSRTLVYHQ